MPWQLGARESTGFAGEFTLLTLNGDPVDITGWTFKSEFERQAGANDFTLNMAGSELAEGFRILEGSEGRYSMRILPATVAGVADTSGDFILYADIIATLPNGERQLIDDIELRVIEGPTA